MPKEGLPYFLIGITESALGTSALTTLPLGLTCSIKGFSFSAKLGIYLIGTQEEEGLAVNIPKTFKGVVVSDLLLSTF